MTAIGLVSRSAGRLHMRNELVGIVGVFAFTLILFVLRHFCLSIGRTNKSRQVNTTAARDNHELNSLAATNDAWLLWNDDPDKQAGSRKPFDGGCDKPHEDDKGQSREGSLQ